MTVHHMTHAALYLRISHDSTGEALGVQRQREDCERLAQARGWEVASIRCENDTSASGKVKRPEFDALLADVEAGRIQVIVAWSLDRLTRNRRDTLRLIETCQDKGVLIALARGSDIDLSTPSGRVTADILAAMARMEIDQKSDRQKRANEQRAARGLPSAGIRAFGYKKGKLEIDEREAEALREMARRFINGESALRIARWLNKAGYTTVKGNPFYPMTVRGMLQNKIYISIRTHNDAEYPAVWPAVFDLETWERVQTALRLRSLSSKQTLIKGRKYLLTGLAYCGRCGMPLSGTKRRDRSSSPIYRAYRCHSMSETQVQEGCGRLRRNADALDWWVTQCVLYRLETPELHRLVAERNESGELRELLAKRDALEAKLRALLLDYTDSTLTKSEYQQAKAIVEGKMQAIQHRLEKVDKRVGATVPTGMSLAEAWECNDDIEWRRAILQLVIKRITVNSSAKKKERYVIDGRSQILDTSAIVIDWNN